MFLFICMIIGYLIGSVPFGLIFSKTFLKMDIRKIGSGATGATNVMRASKWLAVLTLICDFFKVWLAVFLTSLIAPFFDILFVDFNLFAVITGVFAVIGHNFPVWLNFKGGKGFASTLAVMGFVSPFVLLMLLIFWVAIFVISGISSLAALSVLVIAPFVFLFLGFNYFIVCAILFLSLLGIYMHKANILRLLKGEENKFKIWKC